ncbi:uncharacterized protein LOC100679997 [Nasonia vitripennis]|uniref:Uncharacterized protein n=1 Tax=Nasonia vitripennis TaxID=7425 RepID=A0A7M7IMN4_NASVI|nr:uncharacterized protein LOC100679997 [Nasonia vitripennis]
MKGPTETRSSANDKTFHPSSPPPSYPGFEHEIRDHLMGDGLRVKMNSNASNLWIQGDGCRVTLAINSGLLRVSGDGCRVHIVRNLGSVEYLGDGGRIILGPESVNGREQVKYRGDGGVIEFGETRKSSGKKSEADGEKKKKKRETSSSSTSKSRVNEDGSVTVTKITTTSTPTAGKKTEGKKRLSEAIGCPNVYVNLCIKNKC